MQYEVTGNKLTITIDISPKAVSDAKPSASGKSRVVASTGGFVAVPGTDIKFGLNVITK